MPQHVVVFILVLYLSYLKLVTTFQGAAIGMGVAFGLFGLGFGLGSTNTPNLFVACKPDYFEQTTLLVGMQAPDTQTLYVFCGWHRFLTFHSDVRCIKKAGMARMNCLVSC